MRSFRASRKRRQASSREAEEKEPWCDLPQMGDVVLSLNASTRVHVEISEPCLNIRLTC